MPSARLPSLSSPLLFPRVLHASLSTLSCLLNLPIVSPATRMILHEAVHVPARLGTIASSSSPSNSTAPFRTPPPVPTVLLQGQALRLMPSGRKLCESDRRRPRRCTCIVFRVHIHVNASKHIELSQCSTANSTCEGFRKAPPAIPAESVQPDRVIWLRERADNERSYVCQRLSVRLPRLPSTSTKPLNSSINKIKISNMQFFCC